MYCTHIHIIPTYANLFFKAANVNLKALFDIEWN